MIERLVWYGQLTTRRRLSVRGLAFVLLAVGWLTVFLTFPMILLVAVGFAQRGDYGEVVWDFWLGNLKRLIGFGFFGWSADYLWILGRSIWIAIVTTLLSLLLAYPLAFFIAGRPRRTRYLWLALVIIPFCTNLVIRTSAWMLILGSQMPPAKLARFLGLIPADAAIYPGPLAIYLGMVSSCLPFAVLPLYTNVERLDYSIIEAARDLYSSRWRTFRHAILPQTIPGLRVALILTFIPAMGAFVVPDLLGGSKYMLVGNLIQDQFGTSRDWPFGAAVSFGLMLLTLVGLLLLRRRRRVEEAP